jgi:hypothetical protein
MDLRANRRPGQHDLTMDSMGEAFQVVRAMGLTVSAAKLTVHSFFERQWPMTIRMDVDSLQELAEGFNPPSPEFTNYLEGIGQVANTGADIIPLPVRTAPQSEAAGSGAISQ